ncbi:heterokaryon incompatibility protein-domain-containing protein [Xylaria arbuscula]|nr:heterokaryon incompatibility protein-domain-containing protein [Xylaria arbuscula]
MWLIDTLTLKLVLHPSQPSNEYVILSHTWEDEEVTFQDFQNLDVARTKKGFSKIEETCRLACKFKMKWAWVDTCCIDKTSSAELSEAINSMYRWYQNATLCCAYLSDLPAEDDGALSTLQTDHQMTADSTKRPSKQNSKGVESAKDLQKESRGSMEVLGDKSKKHLKRKRSIGHSQAEVRLAQCRWFTRGWTLQELLAPSNIEFYDQQWNLRGTKESLKYPLSAITGIDVQALMKSRPLEDYPVAVRMSWGAKRETSRLEDIAYCLLGIFDIYMPMLYGEGENAFLRLQEEICKSTDDLSIFAWKRQHPDGFLNSGLFARPPAEYSSCRGLVRFSPSRRRDNGFKVTSNALVFDKGLTLSSTAESKILMLDCYSPESSEAQNPAPLGILLDDIDGYSVRREAYRLYKDVYIDPHRGTVQTINAKKILTPREAIPRALKRASLISITLLIPQLVSVISYFPLPTETGPVDNNYDHCVWYVDDSAYLIYCHFRITGPWTEGRRTGGRRAKGRFTIDPAKANSTFQAVVAWGLDASDGTWKAFVWTEQSSLWQQIIDIIEMEDEGRPCFWPQNYVLRELLVAENLFRGERPETVEATWNEGTERVLIQAKQSNPDGRQQLKIMIQWPKDSETRHVEEETEERA